MPRNVATPEQSARVQSEVGVGSGFGKAGGNLRVDGEIASNRVAGVRPLRKSDRRLLNAGDPAIYIYNVSPVWQWTRPMIRKGEVVIPRRGKLPAKVSLPLTIPGAVVGDYDAGNRFRQQFVEDGVSVAEDILCCSKEMPGMPQNDLTGYGCFYLVGQKFEELIESEQDAILVEARRKHEEKCREKALEADQLADNDITRRWVTSCEMYKLCALFLAEECGDKTMLERRWVSRRGRTTIVTECKWCGAENKPNLVVCPNCKNVLDEERFEELKNRSPKGKSRPAPEQTA